MNVLLDTNVILLQRHHHFENALKLFKIQETRREIVYFVSASIMTDLFYILAKHLDRKRARAFLGDLAAAINICPVTETHIHKALDSTISDFEDGVQYYAAIDAGVTVIVTRNTADFPRDQIKILKPVDFLNSNLS